MKNLTKLRNSLENFNNAFQELSTNFDLLEDGNIKEHLESGYPMERCMSELSYEVHNWVENCIEDIDEEPQEKFIVCKKDNDLGFEPGCFYEAKVKALFDYAAVTENISGRPTIPVEINCKQYEDIFFEVPKPIYDSYEYYLHSGDPEDAEAVKQLAIDLCDKE